MKPRKLKYMLLMEEFKETPQYRAGRLLQALLDKIAVWFKTGSFSKQNVKCTYLERADTDSGLQNTVTARFHDHKFLRNKVPRYVLPGTVGITPIPGLMQKWL